jgi:hypothetical protein
MLCTGLTCGDIPGLSIKPCDEAELGLVALSLAVEPRIGICCRDMRLVRPFLAVQLYFGRRPLLAGCQSKTDWSVARKDDADCADLRERAMLHRDRPMTEEGRKRKGFGCDPVEREPRADIVDRSKITSLCKKRIACFDRRDKNLVRFARDRMRRFVEGRSRSDHGVSGMPGRLGRRGQSVCGLTCLLRNSIWLGLGSMGSTPRS